MLVCWPALQNWNSFLSPSTQLMHTFSAEYFQFLHSEWTLIFGTGCLSYKQGVKELWGPKCSIAHVERYCNPVALGQALHFQFIGLLKSCMFIHTLHCPFSFQDRCFPPYELTILLPLKPKSSQVNNKKSQYCLSTTSFGIVGH